MSINYPLVLPSSPLAKNASMFLEFAQASSESPFTLKEQIYSYEAERWVLNVQYPALTPVQAKTIKAFLLSLKGRIGTFKYGDPLNASPSGNPGNNVKVNGSGQQGYELNVKGLVPNANPAFSAGDDFQLNDRLYTVVKVVSASGAGTATLDIMPSLRGTISDNDVITTLNPQAIFRLDSARVAWANSAELAYDISFSAVEA